MKLISDLKEALTGQHIRGWEETLIQKVKTEVGTLPAEAGVEALERLLFGPHGRIGILVFLNMLVHALEGIDDSGVTRIGAGLYPLLPAGGGEPDIFCSTPEVADEVRAALAPKTESRLPDIEIVSAKAHEAWMEQKLLAGVTTRQLEGGEELMVPYEQLSETAKELDRATVRAVYAAIDAARAPQGAPNVL